MKRIYIAGPMRGIPRFNFPAFDDASSEIRVGGWFTPVSPADIDRENGFDPWTLPDDYDWNIIPPSAGTREEIIRRDFEALMTCNAIYMLPGWEKSTGAIAELHLARWSGLQLLHHRDAVSPIGQLPFTLPKTGVQHEPQAAVKEDICEEALRITSGNRNASYGPPDQDFRRTAGMWSALFGDLLKDGVVFEPFHIAQAMILLKMSRQLHQRKRDNWVDTAGYARCGQICDEAARNAAQP